MVRKEPAFRQIILKKEYILYIIANILAKFRFFPNQGILGKRSAAVCFLPFCVNYL